jgi:hypothetical protein
MYGLDDYLDSLDGDTSDYGYPADMIADEACENPRGKRAMSAVSNTANLRAADVYAVTVARDSVESEIDALAPVFAPDVAMWRNMVSWAWQRALAHGEIETTEKRGDKLRPGDVVDESMTHLLYRLLERVSDGVNWNGKEYTLWRVVSTNTPRAAVHMKTVFDENMYRIVEDNR